jgi:cholesterol transport system auxiliary component
MKSLFSATGTVSGALLALALAGCSGLTSRDVATVSYVLRPPAVAAPVAASGAAASAPGVGADTGAVAARLAATSLKVVRVVAQPGYSGDRVLLLGDDRSLGFFAASRWVDALPAVVGTLAVESLRGTARLRAVHDENAPFAADYTLRLTIRRFDAQYAASGQPPRVTVDLECAIGRRTDRTAVASFAVEGQAVAADDRMRDVVAAFEQAAQQALAEAVRRTIATLEADLAALPAAPSASAAAPAATISPSGDASNS